MSLLDRLRVRRRVIIREAPLLKPAEIRSALCVPEDEPLWRTIHQLLETEIESCQAELTDVDNVGRPGLQSYYAGAVAHLEKFQEWLYDQREDAMKQREAFEEGE